MKPVDIIDHEASDLIYTIVIQLPGTPTKDGRRAVKDIVRQSLEDSFKHVKLNEHHHCD